jgi:hypothetical protein
MEDFGAFQATKALKPLARAPAGRFRSRRSEGFLQRRARGGEGGSVSGGAYGGDGAWASSRTSPCL